MAKSKTALEPGIDAHFEKELAEHGLAGMFKRIPDRSDMHVTCASTGLPRLDKCLHPELLGMPRGRDVEISSRHPEVGKTSLGLDIGVAWQRQGLRVAVIDLENTITQAFLAEQGYDIDGKKYPPPYLSKGYDEDTLDVLTAEQNLETIGKACRLFDLVIVDSMPALAKAADLEKDPEDSAQPGGIGKIMFDHVRKYTAKSGTVIWINQQRQQIGGYNPTGQARYKSAGGDAIPFFGSIRIELTLVEKLKEKVEGIEEVYGVTVLANIVKNKIAPPYRSTNLTYLNGEGFSALWDHFQMAKSRGIVEKKGSWLIFGDAKIQGDLSFYRAMKADPALATAIMAATKEFM